MATFRGARQVRDLVVRQASADSIGRDDGWARWGVNLVGRALRNMPVAQRYKILTCTERKSSAAAEPCALTRGSFVQMINGISYRAPSPNEVS